MLPKKTNLAYPSNVKINKINKLDSADRRRAGISRFLVITLFAVIGTFAAFDLVSDLDEGTTTLHLIVEGVVALVSIIAALTLALILIREGMESRAANQELSKNLLLSQEAAAAWRAEAQNLLDGLGASINKQFGSWQLTPVEKDIALFLLKGLSHKEVAIIRDVSDATVRQQARSIYQKAGVAGRHELAAFFLEDLTLPIG